MFNSVVAAAVTSGRSCACCGLSRVGPTRTGRRSVSRSLPGEMQTCRNPNLLATANNWAHRIVNAIVLPFRLQCSFGKGTRNGPRFFVFVVNCFLTCSVAADIQTMLEETQLKFEEERQNSLKVLSNTSKEQCESSLNEEYSKFQETYDTFCKEKDAHMQTFRDLLSKVEVEKKKLLEKYEHHMEEETNTLSELDETISEKVTHAEHSVRRVNQDGKSFIVFRKSTGLFLDCGSDDDFDLDEWRC
ncbi:Transmembrane and coiled-coil domain-containing protein 5B [Zea mays]|uniref:Transmembrane and coiled-coil domain-containing protein 5B n=1 Tax=Zea mays TaxID=4577 RepID=A0A1D6HWW0_MAIZE|nr:Transmembrane and coiled-coil domain-containing protein 5B [Zea mays]